MNMTFKYTAILIFISLYGIMSAQYPFKQANQQVQISGTPCEVRGGGNRYHLGVDFPVSVGTDVYSVDQGEYYNIDNCSVAVDEYVFIHMEKDPSFVMLYGTNSIMVPANTFIGQTVLCQTTAPHLHMQKADSSLNSYSSLTWSTIVNGMSVPTWQVNTVWVNPVTDLGITDLGIRPADDLLIYREASTTSNLSTDDYLFGKIDVLINIEDYGINANGSINSTSSSGIRLAPASASFVVLDHDNGAMLYDNDIISFGADLPANTTAATCFHSNATSSDWQFYLTHNPYDSPNDRYWNSRRSSNGASFSSSTDVPENAEYLDGTRLFFESTVLDYGLNFDYRTLPLSPIGATVPTTFFTLDNFWPYITSVSVSQDNIQIFNMTRGSSEGYNAVDIRHLETKHSNSKNE